VDDYPFRVYCPACGTEHVLVRPGKTQPNCDCDDVCGDCGRDYASVSDDPRWPRHSFYGCPECGPFAPSKACKSLTAVTCQGVNSPLKSPSQTTATTPPTVL
jgi:hypothetical protein